MDRSQKLISNFLEARKILFREDLKKSSGFRITRRYADLMDQFVRSIFFDVGFTKKIKEPGQNALAIAALGSYGRREFCLGSDVDLMVIHQSRLSPEMNAIISRALHSLWDAKLEVGHSILTVRECIRLAVNDFQVLTSIMDGRFILGSRSFYRLFEQAFWSRIQREKDTFLKQFLIYYGKRREKYDTEAYFLEPDIKEGIGGLRDLHFMAWMARIHFRCKRLGEIRRFAVFSHFDIDRLSHSNSRLLKVRNHLHLLARRKEDRLLLSYQNNLCKSLGYADRDHITATERFMKDLYLHLNRIRYGADEFLRKALDIIDPIPSEPGPDQLPAEFKVTKGNIVLGEGRLSEKNPLVVLRALNEANRFGLFVGSGFIWEAKNIISKQGKDLAALPDARDLFLNMILKPKNPKIIRLALEIGLITLFIPEFKRIRNLVETGFYHVETVDLHSLKILDTINKISKGIYNDKWPLFMETFRELNHPDWVFLAALLHDIGKGYGKNHSDKGFQLAPRILKKLGIKGKALEVIPFLVKHHLLLANISQHRDLNDEKTSVQVAQTIQDKEVLQMLFLVAVADSFSTGPIARSDWKIMLLVELFLKVKRILERGVLASPDATKRIEKNKRQVLVALGPHFPEKEILNLMEQVSSRYFLNTSIEDMARHFHLALNMGQKRLSWVLQKLTSAPVTRIILCTYDKPGIFGKMVGVLTLNNISVLSASIHTLKNGLAFDIYEVTNPPDPYREEERWDKIHKEIVLALEDRLPLDELIQNKGKTVLDSERYGGVQSKKVTINNEVSDFFTVIEVSSVTRVGLLYELAKEIFSLGLDIRFARFNSDEEKITGNFYVKDSLGQKIYEAERITAVKQALIKGVME